MTGPFFDALAPTTFLENNERDLALQAQLDLWEAIIIMRPIWPRQRLDLTMQKNSSEISEIPVLTEEYRKIDVKVFGKSVSKESLRKVETYFSISHDPDIHMCITCTLHFRVISFLEEAGVSHETHLFVEGENAPATDVAAVIQKVYNEVGGDLLVASRSNKVAASSVVTCRGLMTEICSFEFHSSSLPWQHHVIDLSASSVARHLELTISFGALTKTSLF